MTTKQIFLTSIDDVKEFTAIVNKFQYDIDLKSDKYVVDAKSIMGIFSLDLSRAVELVIHSYDCLDLLDDIQKFIV